MALRQRGRQLSPFLIKRLVWWCEGEFRKLKPLPEGGTLGDAFAQFRQQTGKPHPQDIEQIEPPDALLYLWDWFWELAQGRTFGPEGVQMPISNLELLAWSSLIGVRLQRWELIALRAIDGAYLRISAEKGA